MKFNKFTDKGIAIMYPTGGYGNFLYKILTDHLESTVKIEDQHFAFSSTGNSHYTRKYSEPFKLGVAQATKQLKSFSYSYELYDSDVAEQIAEGKSFLILADTGNLGDNVKFVRKYFPNCQIVRVYASTFEEKLLLWANCITKSLSQHSTDIYKTSLHTRAGIAKFANKHPDDITDQDAINCLSNFLKNDFGQYGKNFTNPVDGVVNFPIRNFFTVDELYTSLHQLANLLGTQIVNSQQLVTTLREFHKLQQNIHMDFNADPIIGPALAGYEINKEEI
jgi:hypothetical protein